MLNVRLPKNPPTKFAEEMKEIVSSEIGGVSKRTFGFTGLSRLVATPPTRLACYAGIWACLGQAIYSSDMKLLARISLESNKTS